MIELVFTSGPLSGQRMPLTAELTLGRHGTDVVIDDPEISRRHAAFRPIGDGGEVEDLGSLNGTLVNNLPISKPTTVADGDVVEMGRTAIRVEVKTGTPTEAGRAEPAAAPASPTPPVVEPASPDATPILPPPPAEEPAPVVRDATVVVSGAPMSYVYSGQRFLLGVGDGFYGIWDRASLTIPVRRFPKTDAGWAEAWGVYAGWEPNATRV